MLEDQWKTMKKMICNIQKENDRTHNIDNNNNLAMWWQQCTE